MMTRCSDESSENEGLFMKKNNSSQNKFVERRRSKNKSENIVANNKHGIVVNEKTQEKFAIKQSPVRFGSKMKTNEFNRLEDRDLKQVGENPNIQSQHSSDDEHLNKPHTTNSIKLERFSSDSESSDGNPIFRRTSRRSKLAFGDSDDEAATPKNSEHSMRVHDSGDELIDNSKITAAIEEDFIRKPTKLSAVLIKKEIVSKNEEEALDCAKLSKIETNTNFSQHTMSPSFGSEDEENERVAGNSSDSDSVIPPSQFWLHQYKKPKLNFDKASGNISKKLSAIKNLDSKDGSTIVETPLINSRSPLKKEPHRKSPPRITKTEIISEKYKRINQKTLKDEIESSHEKQSIMNNADTVKGTNSKLTTLKTNSFNTYYSQGSSNNEDNLDSSGDELRKKLKSHSASQASEISQTQLKEILASERKISNDTFSDNTEQIALVSANKSKNYKNSRDSSKQKTAGKSKILNSSFGHQRALREFDSTNEPLSPKKSQTVLDNDSRDNKMSVNLDSFNKSHNANKSQCSTNQMLAVKLELPDHSSSHSKVQSELDCTTETQSPKKLQNSLKRKLAAKQKLSDNDSIIEPNVKVQKKTAMNQNLRKKLANEPSVITSEPSSDGGSNKKVDLQKTTPSKNIVLSLKRPNHISALGSKFDNTQMILEFKSNNKYSETGTFNNASNALSFVEDQSTSHKFSTSDQANSDDDNPFEKSFSNNIPALTDSVLPKKKSRRIRDSSNEADPFVAETCTNDQHETEQDNQISRLVSSPKKSGLGDGLENKEVYSPGEVKTPLRRKRSEADTDMPVSKKRSKLTSSVTKKFPQAISDSDDTDYLTQLNTTLNKSMALMENKSEAVKSSRSRKSVSINMNHASARKSNGTKTQKGILKKPEYLTNDKNEENVSDSQEQTDVQQNDQPIETLQETIKRPSNLPDFQRQESLIEDYSKVSFALNDLSDDDEIFIMDVPKTVNPKELKGQKIRLWGKNKLQIANQLYETYEEDPTNISCVFSIDGEQCSYKAVNLTPVGCMRVRQKLPKSLHIEMASVEKITVPFPENLKVRHPLFGAAYEDKINTKHNKILNDNGSLKAKSEAKLKTNKKANNASEKRPPIKIEKLSMKTENVQTNEKKEEDKSNFEDDVERTVQRNSNYSVSSDSDSNESFFQNVKHKGIGKHEKNKNSPKNLFTSNVDEIPLFTSSTCRTAKPILTSQQKLSSVKNLGLSLNSSTTKLENFDNLSEDSKFFSSTPIKVDTDQKRDEIFSIKVGKKKNRGNDIK
ncbi:uncharacterized protein LOC107226779 [Neodiprion lecontei]|uniref:Uncharacterized protein LOC107226779 n=1 Tax=Neodiprion lecontei TaxID=441921 RepID=A0ABM3FCW0_NEOLC|nr:uncharacterized protein LOC107226779 [Neodiprion lecontei]